MPHLRALHLHRAGFYSFDELRLRWGVSNAPIERLVRKKILTEHRFDRRYRYYKIEDVELIERTGLRPKPKAVAQGRRKNRFDPHWIEAEAFRMFRDGASRSDIVCALTITSEEVDRLYKRFKDDNLHEIYVRGER